MALTWLLEQDGSQGEDAQQFSTSQGRMKRTLSLVSSGPMPTEAPSAGYEPWVAAFAGAAPFADRSLAIVSASSRFELTVLGS